MAKAVKTVGTILVVGGLALATAGAALIPAIAGGGLAGALGTAIGGITAGQLITVGSILSSVGATPKVGAGGSPTQWKIDPDGGIPFAIGQVGVAGTIVYRREFGPENMYQGVVSVLSGAGPINRFVSFTASDEEVLFNGTGKAITSQYSGELFSQTRLGTSNQTYMAQGGLKSGATLTGWTPSHRLLGKAARMLTMAENSKGTAFPNGEPAPLDVIEGILYWDPRQDSTYPGGSGSCRLDNPATWVYGTNPIIHALKWWLGYFENGKLVGGVGMSPDAIDIAAFVECANIADANGWIISAYPNTKDDKHQVGIAMLQAGGAVYASVAGKVSCISRGAPRASLLNVTGGDTAGPVEIDAAASRVGRINTIIPKFNGGAAFRYEMTSGGPVSFSGYVDQDRGNTRIRGVDYPYVPQATQAAQLAAFDIVDSREGIVGVVPFKPHMRRLKPGMAFTFSEPGFVLSGLKCLVLNREYNPADGVVKITFRSETDGKYDLALGKTTTVPPAPSLEPSDPTISPPRPEDWDVVVRPPDPGGTSQPGLNITGFVDNARAAFVVVEYAFPPDPPPPDPIPEPLPGEPQLKWEDYLDWVQAYSGPSTVERIEIVGLQPGAEYYLAISYRSKDGVPSDRTIYGPYTAGDFVAQPGGQGDMTPPGVPTGLALSSTVETNATTSEPEVSIIATWTANTETDLAGYEVEVSQAGTAIVEAAGTNRYTRRARSGSVYGIRVRAYDKAGNRSAWTTQQTVVGGLDTIPPSPPTGLSVNVSLGAFFLRWTAPGDSDVAAVEVYEATSNSTAGAELVATVPALPFGDSGVTISRPTGSIRWFFLRAIDTSKNRSTWTSGVQGTIPAINGASDVIARSITAGSIALGTLTGDLIQAQAITTDKLAVTGALPVGLTVGPTGATLGTIDTRSNNPAARVNENTTLIAPGRVQITGSTDLTHWRDGGDNTSIRGGAIAANSVTANKLEIGARGVFFDRFNFRTSGNTLTWDTGRASYTNDSGTAVQRDIIAGSYTYTATGGDISFVYWAKDSDVLLVTKSAGVAMNAGTVLVGSYYGGRLFTATYGKTVIDETGISTPSLSAISANMGLVTAGRIQSPDAGTFFDLNNSRAQFQVGGYVKRIGAIGSGVLEWFGPASVPVGSETRTNGAFAQGTDGVVYFGNAPLSPGGGGARRKIESYTGQATAGSLQLLRAVSFSGLSTGGNVVELDLSFQTVSFSSGLSWTGYITLNQNNGVNETAIGAQQFEFNGGQLYVNGQLASSVKIKGPASYSGAVTYNLYIQGYSSVTLFHNGSVDVSVTPSS